MNLKDTIDKEKFIIHNIKGISMLPLLVQDEDLVLVEKTNEKPELYDMVLFTRENTDDFILHRVMKIKKKYCYIAGDNQDSYEKVYPKQIIGKVTGYYKKGRFVSIKDQEYLDYLMSLEKDLSKRVHLKLITRSTKDFIRLINSALNNETTDQKDFDFEKICKLAKRQKLAAFIFKSIDTEYCPEEIYAKFSDDYNTYLRRSILFNEENEKISEILNREKVDYITLKGKNISSLYPQPETRFQTDSDIYIKDREKIRKIMTGLGYRETVETNMVLCYEKKPVYNYEFHSSLFTSPEFAPYNDLFNKATKISDHEYKLFSEDFIALFLAHMYKHDLSGVGIRFYLDLWLIVNSKDYDEDILISKLKDIKLYDYYQRVLSTCTALFKNHEYPIIELNRILQGNEFGNHNLRIKQEIKRTGRLKYLFHRLFPDKEYMYSSYRTVRKYPILLPFSYVYRIINFNQRKNHSQEIKTLFK